jgi:hypothetical protein
MRTWTWINTGSELLDRKEEIGEGNDRMFRFQGHRFSLREVNVMLLRRKEIFIECEKV